MSNAQQVLTTFAQGYSPNRAANYSTLIEQVAQRVEADPENAARIVRGEAQRIGVAVPQHVIDQIEAAVRQEPESTVEVEGDEPTLDFLTDAQVDALVDVAREAGYRGNEEDLRDRFVSAGLLAEPEPEPEPEVEEPVEVDAGLFQRLVAFAKSKGFGG